MKHSPLLTNQFFFATAPQPCPYLDDRTERRIVTELVGRNVNQLHHSLSQAGFRRSHAIAYAPACPDCTACQAVRIRVDDFNQSRSQRRVWSANRDLTGQAMEPVATQEQFDLFQHYIHTRHGDGDMALMTDEDYQALVEETPINSTVVEFRDCEGDLIAACLTDVMDDGLSAVYSFFDGEQSKRSLGTYMVLWLVDYARHLGLPYVYLGYLIEGCAKMDYKSNFSPLESYTIDGWRIYSGEK